MLRQFAFALCLLSPTGLAADEPRLVPYEGSFDDATFAVETAIVGKGLVIDYVSHVGEMLARTSSDVGGQKEIFVAAEIFLFCSAVLSREMMEADAMNVAHCPYGVFVAETATEGVVIGRRDYPDGVMKKVEDLLDEIIDEASEG